MHLNHILKSKTQIIVTLALALGIVSCGSYEYAGYDNDSIYNDTKKATIIKSESPSSTNNQYYQNYFKEKTEEYALYAEDEDAIFTDIESYEGDYNEENDTAEGESYAGWGGNNSDITINVYGGHSFNSIWWNNPYYTSWGWNNGYGYGNVWGYGFNNYYGWNRPLWLDYGWGWGWGWNRPYWNAGYYNSPYYGNGYYNGYNESAYQGRSLSYNRTRRGTVTAARTGETATSMNQRRTVGSSNRSRGAISSEVNRRTVGRSNLGTRKVVNNDKTSRLVGNKSTSKRTRPSVQLSNSRSRPKGNVRPSSNRNSSQSRNVSRSNSSRSNYNSNASRSNSSRSNSSRSSMSSSSSRVSKSSSRKGNN